MCSKLELNSLNTNLNLIVDDIEKTCLQNLSLTLKLSIKKSAAVQEM